MGKNLNAWERFLRRMRKKLTNAIIGRFQADAARASWVQLSSETNQL